MLLQKRVENLLKKRDCSLTRRRFKKNGSYSYVSLNYEDVCSRHKSSPKWLGILKKLTGEDEEQHLHVDLDENMLQYMAKRRAIYRDIKRKVRKRQQDDMKDLMRMAQSGVWKRQHEKADKGSLDDMKATQVPSDTSSSAGRLILKIKMRSKLFILISRLLEFLKYHPLYYLSSCKRNVNRRER
jgi:hypothetical protein